MNSISVSVAIVIVTADFDHSFFKTIASLQPSLASIDRVYVICPNTDIPNFWKFNSNKFLFLHDQGSGIYPAMNMILLQDPVEDYILFLNAGDELISNKYISECKSRLSLDENVAAVISGYRTKYRDSKSRLFEWFLGVREVSPRFDPKQIKQCAFLISFSVFKDLNGFDSRFKFAADYDLFMKVLSSNRSITIDTISTIFYLDGISSKNRVDSLDDQYLVDQKYSVKSYKASFKKYSVYRLKKLRAILIDKLNY